MLSPKHFVSIGTYLPSAVLLAVSYALSSVSVVVVAGFDFRKLFFVWWWLKLRVLFWRLCR